MNDFSEIAYGLELIRKVFSNPLGRSFRDVIDDTIPGTVATVDKLLPAWEREWRLDTYIACVSRHETKEDTSGRLSMWRAYGDIAMVVHSTPMTVATDALGVYSMPVLYLSETELAARINEVTDAIKANQDYLRALGQDCLVSYVNGMLLRFAIATKHPGFEEEREWRLYYHPASQASPHMRKDTVVIGGVPQPVYKLRLTHDPASGLVGADIPSLLDRIIIGPTDFPYATLRAFIDILEELGLQNAHSKVVASDIPLRTK